MNHTTPPPGDWRHKAVCRDEDPELFFPVGNTGPAADQIQEAKAVCRRCPVASHCLNWAFQSNEEFGVWGGMSEDERRAVKRRRARQARAHAGRKSQQGKPTELSDADVALILTRLDAGAYLPELERETGIGREVCRRVWREHRPTRNPPGRKRTRKTSDEEVVDPVAVQMACAGKRPDTLRPVDRAEAIRRLAQAGHKQSAIAGLLHMAGGTVKKALNEMPQGETA